MSFENSPYRWRIWQAESDINFAETNISLAKRLILNGSNVDTAELLLKESMDELDKAREELDFWVSRHWSETA